MLREGLRCPQRLAAGVAPQGTRPSVCPHPVDHPQHCHLCMSHPCIRLHPSSLPRMWLGGSQLWRLSNVSGVPWCSGTRGSPMLRVLPVPTMARGHGEGGQEAGDEGGLCWCHPWGQRNPTQNSDGAKRGDPVPSSGDARPLPVALGTLAGPCSSGTAGGGDRSCDWGQLVALEMRVPTGTGWGVLPSSPSALWQWDVGCGCEWAAGCGMWM